MMSLPSSTPGGRPADDDAGRSVTTGIGSMVAPAADEEDEEAAPPPLRPTFTAKASEPEASPVPGQAPAQDDAAEPDYAAEPEVTVPTAPALGPDAGPALADGNLAQARPLTTAAGLDEPLLSDADGFRLRWQRAQAGFIDDPREAVGEAADLIEQTAQALVGALRQRQRQLRVMWESGPAGASADGAPAAASADTEHLRLMMQRYRALFNQLCRP
jgi:hypothetical protein